MKKSENTGTMWYSEILREVYDKFVEFDSNGTVTLNTFSVSVEFDGVPDKMWYIADSSFVGWTVTETNFSKRDNKIFQSWEDAFDYVISRSSYLKMQEAIG